VSEGIWSLVESNVTRRRTCN